MTMVLRMGIGGGSGGSWLFRSLEVVDLQLLNNNNGQQQHSSSHSDTTTTTTSTPIMFKIWVGGCGAARRLPRGQQRRHIKQMGCWPVGT